MRTRTIAVAAAGVGAALLTASGITYAMTSGSAPASASAHKAAVSVRPAAKPVQQAAPAPARPVAGSANEEKGGDRGGEGRDREGGGRDRGHRDEGRVYFNDRAYSAAADGCITAASGLGSSSFNVFNDSWKTVEVFRGFTCDNGAPVATVGPHGDTNGVVTRTVNGGLMFGDDGVVGSFRVLNGHDDDEW